MITFMNRWYIWLCISLSPKDLVYNVLDRVTVLRNNPVILNYRKDLGIFMGPIVVLSKTDVTKPQLGF